MSDAAAPPIRRSRLNPFAFPSDTTLRFILLVIFVVCGSGRLYGDFREDARMDQVASECISNVWSHINGILNPDTSEDAEKIGILGREVFSEIAKCSEMLRPKVWWSISGVLLTFGVAAVIYWLYPAWKLKAGGFTKITPSELPEIEQELRDICQVSGIRDPPNFVWNPIASGLPLAFGRSGRYYVALTGSFIIKYLCGDKGTFRAIILHELAHIRNGDVGKTYWVISLWLAFLIISIVPSLVVVSWCLVNWRLAYVFTLINDNVLCAGVILLWGSAVLRAREYYADVRTSVWCGVSQVDRALFALPDIFPRRWRPIF
jgi:Zn-dependent protease with chaperone function